MICVHIYYIYTHINTCQILEIRAKVIQFVTCIDQVFCFYPGFIIPLRVGPLGPIAVAGFPLYSFYQFYGAAVVVICILVSCVAKEDGLFGNFWGYWS